MSYLSFEFIQGKSWTPSYTLDSKYTITFYAQVLYKNLLLKLETLKKYMSVNVDCERTQYPRNKRKAFNLSSDLIILIQISLL